MAAGILPVHRCPTPVCAPSSLIRTCSVFKCSTSTRENVITVLQYRGPHELNAVQGSARFLLVFNTLSRKSSSCTVPPPTPHPPAPQLGFINAIVRPLFVSVNEIIDTGAALAHIDANVATWERELGDNPPSTPVAPAHEDSKEESKDAGSADAAAAAGAAGDGAGPISIHVEVDHE